MPIDANELTLDELAIALAPAVADSAVFDGWSNAAVDAAAQMEGVALRQTVKEQERRIADLGETNDELRRANQVQGGELEALREQLAAAQSKEQSVTQRNHELVELCSIHNYFIMRLDPQI